MRTFDQWAKTPQRLSIAYGLILATLFCLDELGLITDSGWLLFVGCLLNILIYMAFTIFTSNYVLANKRLDTWRMRIIGIFFPPIKINKEIALSSKDYKIVIALAILSIFLPLVLILNASNTIQLFSFHFSTKAALSTYSFLCLLLLFIMPHTLLTLILYLKSRKLLLIKEGKVSKYTVILICMFGLSLFFALLVICAQL